MGASKIFELIDISPDTFPGFASRPIVLCHGVFDLFHFGHLRYLEAAKALGNYLVVSVTSDRYVNKGPGRPVFSQEQRATMLASLQIVDAVVISDEITAEQVIGKLKPDFFVKGKDYQETGGDPTGNLERERKLVEQQGGQLAFTDSPLWSSSALINSFGPNHNDRAGRWLERHGGTWDRATFSRALRRLENLEVVVVGETILDQYTEVRALGKSSKTPVLAFQELETSSQFGGAVAVALHAKGLGSRVRLVSAMDENHRDDLKNLGLLDDAELQYVFSGKESLTVKKRRFIDDGTRAQVFETYNIDAPQLDACGPIVKDSLSSALSTADVLIVADYGHGLLTSDIRRQVNSFGGFRAANAQANAGNRGINSIAKYKGSTLVCMNGRELENELRQPRQVVREDLEQIQKATEASWVVVTEGKFGLAIYASDSGFFEVPAYSGEVVDPVGAGDAVLVASALLLSTGASPELVGFLSNLAGAELVATLGNGAYLSSRNLQKHAEALIKRY